MNLLLRAAESCRRGEALERIRAAHLPGTALVVRRHEVASAWKQSRFVGADNNPSGNALRLKGQTMFWWLEHRPVFRGTRHGIRSID